MRIYPIHAALRAHHGKLHTGAMTMFVFALGTFLCSHSFPSARSISRTNRGRGIFFKTAGIIVIALALFNLLNALATAGIINPLFSI